MVVFLVLEEVLVQDQHDRQARINSEPWLLLVRAHRPPHAGQSAGVAPKKNVGRITFVLTRTVSVCRVLGRQGELLPSGLGSEACKGKKFHSGSCSHRCTQLCQLKGKIIVFSGLLQSYLLY